MNRHLEIHLLILMLLAIVVGCKAEKPLAPASLSSRQVDIGESVDNRDIAFDIEVIAQRECVVRSIFVDCGCIQPVVPANDIPLSKGQNKAFPFVLSVGKQAGEKVKYVHFEVEDKLGEMKRLSCGVRYKVIPSPSVEPPDAKAIRIEGRENYLLNATVVTRRLKIDVPITVNWEKSELGKFEKIASSFESFQYINSDVMEDRTTFTISTHSKDESSQSLVFVLSDGSTVESVVPQLTIHPLVTDLDRLFLGFVNQPSSLKKRIFVDNVSDQTVSIKHISFAGGGSVKSPCPIEILPNQKLPVELEFDLGTSIGRQHGKLSLVPANRDISPVQVDVSWINPESN